MSSDFSASWTAFGDSTNRQIVLTAEPVPPDGHWQQLRFGELHSTEIVKIWTVEPVHPVRVEASGLDSMSDLDHAIGKISTTEAGIAGSLALYGETHDEGTLPVWYWRHGITEIDFRSGGKAERRGLRAR